jgi:demethylphylloquinol methyltransferase
MFLTAVSSAKRVAILRDQRVSIESYNALAWIYEWLGQLYSGGRIYAAKASQMCQIRPGDSVLYAGVGPGEDAVLAGELGASVTCIDVAPKMLAKVQSRFEDAGCRARYLCGDVLAHHLTGHYDVVVANFFLNVFAEARMQTILNHLATLVKPGGKLLIADFSAPRGGRLARWAQAVYWGVTNAFYYVMGLCAWHSIYDYPKFFQAAGLDPEATELFPLGRSGLVGFCAITARRPCQ